MKLKRRSAKPVDERREGSANPPRERPDPLVAGLAVAEREVAPARAVAGLAVAAAILLARALSPASGRRARPQTARERSRERAARLGAPGVPEASS